MSISETKTMLDLQKKTVDQSFGVICLGEQRTDENIDTCIKELDSLVLLSKRLKEEIYACLHREVPPQ